MLGIFHQRPAAAAEMSTDLAPISFVLDVGDVTCAPREISCSSCDIGVIPCAGPHTFHNNLHWNKTKTSSPVHHSLDQ